MAYLIGGPSDLLLTSTTLTEGKGFALGTRTKDENGADWCFVKAAAAITQYDTVHIDEGYLANAITKALADDAGQVGFAQVAFASGEYGWVMISNGEPTVRAAGSALPNVPLWTSDTAGVLTSNAASASHFPIFGVTLAASGSAGATENVAAYAAYPVVRTTNA